MNNKILLTGLVLVSLASTSMAVGVNNTVDPNAALYGAEAYGKNNVIAATGTSAFAVGYNNTVAGDNAFVYGNANKATGTNSIAGGEYSKATGRNSVAIGSSAQALKNDTFAIGSQARANGEDALAFGNGAYAENTATVAIGKTVKAEADSTVAIGVRTNASGNSTVAIGRDNSVAAANTTVIGSNNGSIAADQSVVVGYNNTVVGTNPEQLVFGSNSKTEGQGAIAVGTHAEATAMDALAIGNNTLADNANSVAIGTNSVTDSVVNTTSASIGGKTYTFAGTNALSTLSVGSDARSSANGAANYKRTITNVAAGRISDTSTDAVNGSQLNAAIKGIDKNHQDIVDTAKGLQMLGDVVADHEVAITANKQASANAMTEAKKHGSVVAGDNVAVTTGANTANGKEYTISVNKNLTNMNSVNFGANTDSKHSIANKDGMHVFNGEVNANYDSNGIKIENANTLKTAQYTMNGMQASDDNATIRFTTTNIDAGNQQIHGIKAGTANTDVVNVSQLKEVGNKVNDNSKRIDTNENRINDLDNKINDVGRNALERANHYTDLQVNKGVAKASALAGLKFLDYNPKDKWSFAASVGHYRNANAVAVGAAYQPNENTMVHGGITVDGKIAYNLGVSVKVGGQKYINKYELAEQVKQLQSDNAELRQELAELRSMIEKR